MNAITTASMLVAIMIVYPAMSNGQQIEKGVDAEGGPIPVRKTSDLKFQHQSFTFVRIKYSNHRRKSAWATDYPDADLNFTVRFQKVTDLKCDRDGKTMTLTDPELNQFPFIYVTEGAALELDDDEVMALRRYLTGGGFLMVDDFWGEAEWGKFEGQIKRVFPDREPMELKIEHPIFHCFYDIKEKPQVPSIHVALYGRKTGVTWEREDAKEAHYKAIFDDKGRMMAIFCHNTDLADGWERGSEDPWYFKEFSEKKAYPMGINIVVYALTQQTARIP